MPILTRCSSCSRKLRIPDHLLGKLVKCPACSNTFTADEAPEDEPEDHVPAAPAPAQDEDDEPTVRSSSRRRDDDDDDEPPIRRSRVVRRDDEDDEDDEPPVRRSSRRRRDEDEDDEDYAPRRRSGRQKPGKVQAIAIMMLVGGILACINFLAIGAGSTGICCLWPGLYFCLVMGIMAIIKGSQLLGEKGYLQPPPKGIAIMQIVNIINLDVANCVMGIIALVFLNEPETRRYFRG